MCLLKDGCWRNVNDTVVGYVITLTLYSFVISPLWYIWFKSLRINRIVFQYEPGYVIDVKKEFV